MVIKINESKKFNENIIDEMADFNSSNSGKSDIGVQRLLGAVNEISKIVPEFDDEDWDIKGSKLTVRLYNEGSKRTVVCKLKGDEVVVKNETSPKRTSLSVQLSKSNFINDSTRIANAILTV